MDSLARQFIWSGTRTRLSLKTCQRDIYEGGLGMSNIQYYYLAMHALVINDWVGGGWTDPAYQLELQTMGYPRIFGALYWSPIPRETPDVTKVVLQGWRTAQKVTGWWRRLTQQTPLWHGKQLAQVAGLQGFQNWDNIGISTLGDVWQGSHIQSFQDLQTQYSLNKTQFHRYLQLRHALLVHLQAGDTIPEHSPMEAKALMGDLGKGGVSQIYRTLITTAGGPLRELRQRWEDWMGPMEEMDWTEALMAPRSLTMATRLQLIQTYFLHTAYLTPAKLHKAGLRPSAECPRCRSHTADFFHMVWACPTIVAYWEAVVQEISGVLQVEVKRLPLPLPFGGHGRHRAAKSRSVLLRGGMPSGQERHNGRVEGQNCSDTD
ncbi:hypothetical protein NDU88_003034 [Pleurodeles waltl]|uniref:Reverse transcriptase zinc-binding domain-containing protein n=1 Tax=Pleurodeles waltl TaxID=8319 RepID=A0AAV7M9X0_PLEWA|nr:hypothetical protein NDU88_003034 [Pleurodeles waltl]